MQKRNCILLLSLLMTITACQSKSTATLFPTQTPTSTPTVPISIQEKKAAILQEINALVDQYNDFLEKEKSADNYKIIQLPDGSDSVKFTGESAGKVFTELMQVNGKITELNEKYYKLSVEENSSIAYPNETPKANELGKLQSKYSAWLTQELVVGSKIKLVSEDGTKLDMLIGDSYVAMKERENKIAAAQEKANQDYQEYINSDLDIQIIQKIEGKNVQVTFTEAAISSYRTDVAYSTYETQDKYYTLDSNLRLVVRIEPKNMMVGSEGLSVPKLEKMAREMIVLVSPEINLDTLTYSLGQKIGTYFFRWEDRTKPFLDDGQSYPFVQVGLNGKGELLNYINTLPMSREK